VTRWSSIDAIHDQTALTQVHGAFGFAEPD